MLVVLMTCHVLQFLFTGPDIVELAILSAVSFVSGEAAHSLRTSDVLTTDRPPWLHGLGRLERLQRQASFEHDEKVAKLHIPHPVCPRIPH